MYNEEELKALEDLMNDPQVMKSMEESFNSMVMEDKRNDRNQ